MFSLARRHSRIGGTQITDQGRSELRRALPAPPFNKYFPLRIDNGFKRFSILGRLDNLIELDLSNNLLTSVNLPDNRITLKKLNLSGNPF